MDALRAIRLGRADHAAHFFSRLATRLITSALNSVWRGVGAGWRSTNDWIRDASFWVNGLGLDLLISVSGRVGVSGDGRRPGGLHWLGFLGIWGPLTGMAPVGDRLTGRPSSGASQGRYERALRFHSNPDSPTPDKHP